jgi:hypothetical protein
LVLALPAKPNSALFQPLEVAAFLGADEGARKLSPPSKYLLKSHARNTAVGNSANGADMMT